MSDEKKPLKLEEIAAQLLKDGKATDKDIALLMARQQKAKETAKEAARKLKKAQAKQKKSQAEEERKARTHRLIQLGGLVDKAGIGDADPAELLGWFLYFKQASTQPGLTDIRANCKAQGLAAMGNKPATPPTAPAQPAPPAADRVYLNVLIEEKDEAKALGARWDPDLKKWYCLPTDRAKCAKWLPR